MSVTPNHPDTPDQVIENNHRDTQAQPASSTLPAESAEQIAEFATESDTQQTTEQDAIARKKQKSRAANQAAVKLLCDTYPKAFSQTAIQPLKVGIQQELVADDKISQTKIKRGLASYVRQFAYLRSQKTGAVRVNMLGEPSGEVTADEAEHAQSKLPPKQQIRQPVSKSDQVDRKVTKQTGQNRSSAKQSQKNTASKRKSATHKDKTQQSKTYHKSKPKRTNIEKVASPFQGMDETQRFASKLDLLLNKHK